MTQERDAWADAFASAQKRLSRNQVLKPDTQGKIVQLSAEKEALLASYQSGEETAERSEQLRSITAQLTDLWAKRRQERALPRRRN